MQKEITNQEWWAFFWSMFLDSYEEEVVDIFQRVFESMESDDMVKIYIEKRAWEKSLGPAKWAQRAYSMREKGRGPVSGLIDALREGNTGASKRQLEEVLEFFYGPMKHIYVQANFGEEGVPDELTMGNN